MRVLRGRAVPGSAAPAFRPLAEALAPVASEVDASGELAPWLPALGHWSDPETVAVVERLSDNLERAPRDQRPRCVRGPRHEHLRARAARRGTQLHGLSKAAADTLAAMSVAVALERVREAIGETDRAPYLLTVSDDERPHSVAVSWEWDGDELVVAVGTRTLANARARPQVTLLWPPRERDGYSLIIDASVTDTADDTVRLRPTRAVLHRPAAAPTGTACTADCIPLDG